MLVVSCVSFDSVVARTRGVLDRLMLLYGFACGLAACRCHRAALPLVLLYVFACGRLAAATERLCR